MSFMTANSRLLAIQETQIGILQTLCQEFFLYKLFDALHFLRIISLEKRMSKIAISSQR